VAAIERGFPQREIQDSAWKAQRAVDDRTAIVVGVNDFVEAEPPADGLLRVDAALERAQVGRLRAFRAARREGDVRGALRALEDAAAGSANTMPRILAAVQAHATLGEVADTLRGVFGVYQENVVV
jgi:methylmalonyl-CoA mutase N-terminal domain/subunit